MTAAPILNEKIKILVLGDSGVGKSSLVHLICHSQTLQQTRWTIGCSIDIKIHRYKEGTPSEKNYLIEFWDVGGSRSHSIARKIFFNSFHGIILVEDLTNRKSEFNLKNWLGQAIFGVTTTNATAANMNNSFDNYCIADKERYFSNSISQALFPVSDDNDFEYDCESFIGLNIPILIVATKLDLVSSSGAQLSMKNELIELLHCDIIQLNCRNSNSLQPGTTNSVKLSRFLDVVCDKRLQTSSMTQLSPVSPSSSSPTSSTVIFDNQNRNFPYQKPINSYYYLNKMN